ncbi:MAG: MarR family transcriptional regulator [Pseudomonadota bacterium]
MTEITNKSGELPAAIQRFVLHWGDMGGQWGVNRSVAQIHALLLLSDRPRHAEEISETLGIARSNVSTSIKELIAWDLIYRVPIQGDRRDHFAAEGDVWEMVKRIAEGRKKREFDPAAAVLRDCLAEAEGDPAISTTAHARLEEMQDFVDTLGQWHEQMMRVPKSRLVPLIKLGSRAVDLLGPLIRTKK